MCFLEVIVVSSKVFLIRTLTYVFCLLLFFVLIPGFTPVSVGAVEASEQVEESPAKLPDHLFINQAYGTGNNGNGAEHKSFIEIYNPTVEEVDLSSWSLQYISNKGKNEWVKLDLDGVIPPFHSFLIIAVNNSGNNGMNIIPEADMVWSGLKVQSDDFSIALVENQDLLPKDPLIPDLLEELGVVDLVSAAAFPSDISDFDPPRGVADGPWKAGVILYTVTFVDGFGKILKTQIVDQGSSATAPTGLAREGYLFKGWSTTDFTNVVSNLIVTALWTQKIIVTPPNPGNQVTPPPKTETPAYDPSAPSTPAPPAQSQGSSQGSSQYTNQSPGKVSNQVASQGTVKTNTNEISGITGDMELLPPLVLDMTPPIDEPSVSGPGSSDAGSITDGDDRTITISVPPIPLASGFKSILKPWQPWQWMIFAAFVAMAALITINIYLAMRYRKYKNVNR